MLWVACKEPSMRAMEKETTSAARNPCAFLNGPGRWRWSSGHPLAGLQLHRRCRLSDGLEFRRLPKRPAWPEREREMRRGTRDISQGYIVRTPRSRKEE
uniref:Uncharacterized protein n=1 Tax=Oryza punctata TaxID=4537 RepID=A0A0E0LEM7_ORYPU